jgi:hypothetical protein
MIFCIVISRCKRWQERRSRIVANGKLEEQKLFLAAWRVKMIIHYQNPLFGAGSTF